MRHNYMVKGDEPLATCIVDLIDAREVLPYKGWVVSRVITREGYRGKGLARQAMAEVLAEADKEGAYLHLEINPYGPMNYAQLEAWYRRLGFRMNKYGYMTRRPQKGGGVKPA